MHLFFWFVGDMFAILTFRHFKYDKSEMLAILFSARFRNSSLQLVVKCSMALMLLPSRLRWRSCDNSFMPSIVRMPL